MSDGICPKCDLGILFCVCPRPAEPERCDRCGWPLAESLDKGCVKDNCSMRPLPPKREPMSDAAARDRKTNSSGGPWLSGQSPGRADDAAAKVDVRAALVKALDLRCACWCAYPKGSKCSYCQTYEKIEAVFSNLLTAQAERIATLEGQLAEIRSQLAQNKPLTAHLVAALYDRDELQERIATLERLLRDLEWAGHNGKCPVCLGWDGSPRGNGETPGKHTKTCALRAALASTGKAQAESAEGGTPK